VAEGCAAPAVPSASRAPRDVPDPRNGGPDGIDEPTAAFPCALQDPSVFDGGQADHVHAPGQGSAGAPGPPAKMGTLPIGPGDWPGPTGSP
jgi:hypothetical protein